MSPQVEALQQFFAAINRKDMQAITKDFDRDIIRIEPEGFPTAGTYRGIAQVREHVSAGRGTWAEGSCEPEGFFVNGDKVVVYLYAWVRLKGAGDWTGGRFADGFVFRDGKITEYYSFGERHEALEWAGIVNPMEIRRIRQSEHSAVFELLVENGWGHRILDLDAFTALVDASPVADVAIVEGKIVGFVRAITDGLSNGYLSMLVVASSHRRQGVGTALVDHVVGGNRRVTWLLRAGREGAAAFFTKLGFEVSSIAMERRRE